jgi:hypothetical protein
MPKPTGELEQRVIKAYEAARVEKKENPEFSEDRAGIWRSAR